MYDTPDEKSIAASRAEAVKEHAAALGFDACGIAEAGNIDPLDRLGAWLARGFHADMAWLARNTDVRRDVARWLPEARSVVVAARNYYQPDLPKNTEAGRVARYAWGRDYHRVMKKPMRQLGDFLVALNPETASCISIDSAPVLERSWAAKAGVGWIGKNSLSIRRGLGSWFFLGVIATTLPLRPDTPAKSYCGDCSACINACPTRAIVSPGVVDARRCIAYHTIENRGEIPSFVQDAMGEWVFGCDLCQEVCPWNRAVAPATEPDFRPRPGVAAPRLDDLIDMEEADFTKRFQGTPVMRAKYAGMRRNARIALKNQSSDREAER